MHLVKEEALEQCTFSQVSPPQPLPEPAEKLASPFPPAPALVSPSVIWALEQALEGLKVTGGKEAL